MPADALAQAGIGLKELTQMFLGGDRLLSDINYH